MSSIINLCKKIPGSLLLKFPNCSSQIISVYSAYRYLVLANGYLVPFYFFEFINSNQRKILSQSIFLKAFNQLPTDRFLRGHHSFGIGELLYLEKHRLPAGEQKITIKVSKEPDLAAIDPGRLLIERQIYDNFVEISRTEEGL